MQSFVLTQGLDQFTLVVGIAKQGLSHPLTAQHPATIPPGQPALKAGAMHLDHVGLNMPFDQCCR